MTMGPYYISSNVQDDSMAAGMRKDREATKPAGGSKAKPLIGGVWSDKENNGPTLDEFFAQAKQPVDMETRTDGSPPSLVTPDSSPMVGLYEKRGGPINNRSLVGGSFVIPSSNNAEDEVSLSSTSLMGAGYEEGDQSVVTKQSYMEYSEDDRSARQETSTLTPSLLGNMMQTTTSRAKYLLDRQDHDSESSVSEQSSIFTDDHDYFKRNPILPPSLLPNENHNNTDPLSEDDDSSLPFYSRSSPGSSAPRSPPDFFSGMGDSTDTEIYEDRTFDSSSMDAPLFEDNDSSTTGGCSPLLQNSPPRVHNPDSWSAYNQERGRLLAQKLLQSQGLREVPSSPLSAGGDSPSPKKSFLQQSHNYLRRKTLDRDFTVVDATVKKTLFQAMEEEEQQPPPSDSDSSLADSEHSSSSTSGSAMFPKLPSYDSLYELAKEGQLDDFENHYKGDPFFDVVADASIALPDGFLPRKSPNEIASRTMGGIAALKRLRALLARPSDGSAVTVDGISIPNYQAQVLFQVDQHRRDVLNVSDETYQQLLNGCTTATKS